MKILITGAASGIGFLTALTLAERGHYVYLTCHTQKEVMNVKKKVEEYSNIEVLKIDITSPEDRKKVTDLDVDVLYNHAGYGVSGSVLDVSIDDMRKNFEINVFSSFALLQDVLKKMVDNNHGRIVVMSSLAGEMPLPFAGVYSATKASVTMMVKALKMELRTLDTNVDVALIEPGLYHTGFNHFVIDGKYNDGKYFKNIKDILYEFEHSFLFLAEKKELDSIVVQIVRAIEDDKLKRVYRAPVSQSLLVKVYNLFR